MLFIGTITRMIEGDRHKHCHEPAAYPAAVGTSMLPQHPLSSCRGDILCSACSNQGRNGGPMVSVLAATPVLSHHDARREWRYERRAMRDSRRAARHGYGYRHPVSIPVAAICGPGQGGYAPTYYEPGPSTSRALPDRLRDEYCEDDCLAARAGFGASRIDGNQREASPPKYEAGSWDARRASAGGWTECNGLHRGEDIHLK